MEKGIKLVAVVAAIMKTSNEIMMVNVWFLLLVTKIINGTIANTTEKVAILVDVTRKRTSKTVKWQKLMPTRMTRKNLASRQQRKRMMQSTCLRSLLFIQMDEFILMNHLKVKVKVKLKVKVKVKVRIIQNF